MITGVRSPTIPSFKKLRFTAGLNIVLVNRTEAAGASGKRNGAGKSSLLDVIHFVLGGSKEAKSPLSATELNEAAFSLDLTFDDRPVSATRALNAPGSIDLLGDFSHWPVQPDIADDGSVSITEDAWKDLLGRLMFGLPPASQDRSGWVTFRACFPYFVRRQRNDGYIDWRKHVSGQRAVGWQAPLSFLLGLGREGIVELHRVKEAEREKANLTRLLKSSLIQESLGTPGKLRTRATRVSRQVEKLEADLQGFQVVSAYDELVTEANRLQGEIEDLTNANFLDLEIAANLERSLSDERPPELTDLQRVYAEAGVVLPGVSLEKYGKVEEFHRAILKNRHLHLQAELDDARSRAAQRREVISVAQRRRNGLLSTINSGGALAHYRQMDAQLIQLRAEQQALSAQLELHSKIDLLRSDLKVKRAEAERQITHDLAERSSAVDHAITVFDEISSDLYTQPASLEVKATSDGLGVSIHKPDIASDGVGKMQIFTFDLMLATICSERRSWPGFLIHDSHIFDGVDGRQVATALQTAHRRLSAVNGQYIITINSDDLEKAEREGAVSFRNFVVHPELDDTETGGLFGFKFATDTDPDELTGD
jgi:uncharacterized protein YydD (DUF2326 family)